MLKKDIFIFGSGGYAKIIIDIIKNQAQCNITGVIDVKTVGETVVGYVVIGDESILLDDKYTHVNHGIVAIGDNWIRNKVVAKILEFRPDFKFIQAIHPSAIVADDVIVGDGVVIMAGGIVNPAAKIGNHCIICTNASLDHDSYMGNFASIAPGVVTGGNVAIGQLSHLGVGAKVLHGRSIGEHCIVGAGSVVTKDIAPLTIQYGAPAKFIRTRSIGEKYL